MTTEQMELRLKGRFPDADILVMDLTGTSDHFEVRIASGQFAGQSRIVQHQLVMDVFQQELKTGEVHALTIKPVIK